MENVKEKRDEILIENQRKKCMELVEKSKKNGEIETIEMKPSNDKNHIALDAKAGFEFFLKSYTSHKEGNPIESPKRIKAEQFGDESPITRNKENSNWRLLVVKTPETNGMAFEEQSNASLYIQEAFEEVENEMNKINPSKSRSSYGNSTKYTDKINEKKPIFEIFSPILHKNKEPEEIFDSNSSRELWNVFEDPEKQKSEKSSSQNAGSKDQKALDLSGTLKSVKSNAIIGASCSFHSVSIPRCPVPLHPTNRDFFGIGHVKTTQTKPSKEFDNNHMPPQCQSCAVCQTDSGVSLPKDKSENQNDLSCLSILEEDRFTKCKNTVEVYTKRLEKCLESTLNEKLKTMKCVTFLEIIKSATETALTLASSIHKSKAECSKLRELYEASKDFLNQKDTKNLPIFIQKSQCAFS